ncbi:toxin-antitoxin system YwqK family antitoxin [Spirosoma pulveris]
MKKWLLAGLLLSFGACLFLWLNNSRNPPPVEVVNYDPLLQKTDSGWYYKGALFSGYMVEKEKDGLIVYRLPIVDGRENGLAKGWYNTGEKLLERRFVNEKKEGIYKQWWPNGQPRYVFHYRHDQYDGPQLVFFPDGKKREESRYTLGEQDGPQRVWDKDGKLIANYTIRNKRAYGLTSVKSCLPVMH